MKSVTAIVSAILIGVSALSLLISLAASGAVLSVGLRDTCRERVSTPGQTDLDDAGRLAIEARSRLPFGVECAYQLQDGGEHVQYVEVGTAPTLAFFLFGAVGAIGLARARAAKPTTG